ncbi:hypothetical protein U0A02_23675, partial [Escherichia coli]|nr:hypothetical protein [Escherichia coli]MDY9258407.1 hypothetical protein [Escherichia coli]
MYCTVKEIIRDVLDTDVPDSECVFAVVLTRGDVRHMAQDWNLSDDELETVMQRLDDAFVYGACDRVVSDIVNELMEEKRVNRLVTVNRPGFPGECFICELRLPDHRFRWKHNKLFLLLPEEY